MSTLCKEAVKDALLRGAATLFDLSGTGVFPRVTLAEGAGNQEDVETLRKDFEVIGNDLRLVFRSEIEGSKFDE